MRTPLKVEAMLSPAELEKAFNYITTGGALMELPQRAGKIAKAHGLPRVPRPGYESVLEETEHEKSIMMHTGGQIIVRIWTSVNAPWLLIRKEAQRG
jgi:hypothetical protein